MLAKIISILSLSLFASPVFSMSLTEINNGLQSAEGILAEVHGVATENGYYVLSFRSPNDFFDFTLVSMIANPSHPQSKDIAQYFLTLNRHDQVRIKGKLLDSMSTPQPHALIDSVLLEKAFVNPYPQVPEFQRKTLLPAALTGLDEATFKVHAVFNDGEVLVLEYGDAVIPAYVTATESLNTAKTLFRNDIVKVKFKLISSAQRPAHLKVLSEPNSIVLLDSMLNQNTLPLSFCGTLIMFPKSPQIIFNVFALKLALPNQLTRNYTLVNFESPELFKEIRQKMQNQWDLNLETVSSGRSYFINEKLQICARGIGNVKDPNQANPQILLNSVNDIEITKLEN